MISNMKKLCFSILLLMITSVALQAQSKGAIIKFDKLVHDYGTIYQNADGKSEFTFTNTGDEPLVLSSVRSSCGCTIPSWPKEPIFPGKSGVIIVTYDTKRVGTINKQITVLSNATESQIILNIKGNILQKPDEVFPGKPTNDGLNPNNN
jgi:hypothetical protein